MGTPPITNEKHTIYRWKHSLFNNTHWYLEKLVVLSPLSLWQDVIPHRQRNTLANIFVWQQFPCDENYKDDEGVAELHIGENLRNSVDYTSIKWHWHLYVERVFLIMMIKTTTIFWYFCEIWFNSPIKTKRDDILGWHWFWYRSLLNKVKQRIYSALFAKEAKNRGW